MRAVGLRGAELTEAATALAFIALSGYTATEGDAAGTGIGVLSVIGTTGPPTFALDNNDGGRFQLNGDGVTIEVGGTPPLAGAHNITVSVSGVLPVIAPTVFALTIAPAAVGANRILWGADQILWGVDRILWS